MQIEIHSKLGDAPPRLGPLAERRVRRALRRWSRRLETVQLFLEEEDVPWGGLGTRCRVVLERTRGGTLVATGRGEDAELAISSGMKRAREQLRRREDRRLSRARGRALRGELGSFA
jgi:ribosome-associated translation inhibitor RaiA